MKIVFNNTNGKFLKIISFENGLKKNKTFNSLYPHGASVIIAVRNEQNNIDNLVSSLEVAA